MARSCDHPRPMKSTPIILVLLLCCVLALARMLGVHAHVAHQHAVVVEAVEVDHDHDHGVAHIVSGFDNHAESHLTHAEIDADTADKTSGKLPSLLLFAIIACVAAFLVPARQGTRWETRYRSPPLRRKPHVLPLSQAPPLAV